LSSEEQVSHFVFRPLVWKTMSTAIQFDRQLGERAVGVEEVDAARILAAKFELGETAVAEYTPKASLRIRGFPSEFAGEFAGGGGASAVLAGLRPLPPHPSPLPRWGRGDLALVVT